MSKELKPCPFLLKMKQYMRERRMNHDKIYL